MDKDDILSAIGIGAIILLGIFLLYGWHYYNKLEEDAKACVIVEDESPECKWAIMKYTTEKRNRAPIIHTGRW